MKINWLLKVSIVSACVMVTILCLVMMMLDANRKLTDTTDIRYESYLRADELRQSSDDLTRLARTYVVTGNSLYEDQYWQVLAIRNGEQPRPEDYERIYWDFMAVGEKPRPDGVAVPLQAMMRELGFTTQEFQKLTDAQNNSDGLVELETIAMNAVKGLFADDNGDFTQQGEPDLEMARQLMHSEQYHQYKRQIMGPIDEFLEILDERTLSAVLEGQKTVDFYLRLLIGGIVLSALLALAGFWQMRRQVLMPVSKLALALREVVKNQDAKLTKLDVVGSDEINQVTDYFNKAVDKFSLIMQEVDDKARTALRLQNALNSSSASLLVTDENDVIIYCNSAFHKTFGAIEDDVREHSAGFSVSNLLGNNLHDAFASAREAFSHSGLGKEYRIPFGNSVMQLVASPIVGDGGQRLGIITEWKDKTGAIAKDREKQLAIDSELAQAELVNRKVDELLSVVDSALQGDLTRSVTIKGDDIIGRMGEGVEKLLDELRDNLSHIKSSAGALTTSSDTMKNASRQIDDIARHVAKEMRSVTKTTTEVDNNVDAVATAVTQMSSSIQAISANSGEATEVANQAVDIAQSTDKAVRKLSISSKDIGNVLKAITSIAEQTNLLALNATIEAARAGDAGKGFAVVANEVKELAKETAKATEEIENRIESIQTDSDNTVVAISLIGDTIANISKIQGTIAAAVIEQDATTDEISRTMHATASSTSGITSAINEVSKGVDSTQDGVVQLRETAEEISSMADALYKRVERFKLSKNENDSESGKQPFVCLGTQDG